MTKMSFGIRRSGGYSSVGWMTDHSMSLRNLIKLALVALFVKYQIVFDDQQSVVLGRPMGLIYNKDGKFIYRPSRLHQGHIIVIDDRQKSKQNSATDHQQQIPASSNSIYPQFQLIGANAPTLYHAPEHGSASALRPGGISRTHQPVPLPTMGSAVRLIPLIQFYTAQAPMVSPVPTINQAVVAQPNSLHHPLSPDAPIYSDHFGAVDLGLSHTQAAWQQAPAQLQAHSRDQPQQAQIAQYQQYQHQHQQQQQPPHTMSLDGGHYGSGQDRLESLYAPQLVANSRGYETNSAGSFEQHHQFGGLSHNNQQPSEAAFMDDVVAPPSPMSMTKQTNMMMDNVVPEPNIVLPPQHSYHHGGSSTSRLRSRLSMKDLMSSSQEHGEEWGAIAESPRDDPAGQSTYLAPNYKANYLPSGPVRSSSMDNSVSQSNRGSRHPAELSSSGRSKALPPVTSSGDYVTDARGAGANPVNGGGKLSSHGKRNSQGKARINHNHHHQQQDSSAFRSASLPSGLGPIREGDIQHSSGHDDDSTNAGSRGAEYWKQFRDQFDVLH